MLDRPQDHPLDYEPAPPRRQRGFWPSPLVMVGLCLGLGVLLVDIALVEKVPQRLAGALRASTPFQQAQLAEAALWILLGAAVAVTGL